MFAECDDKYKELVELLRKLTEEHGLYAAMAYMAKSLDIASNATLLSMVVTGMRREMNRGEPGSA